MKKITGSQIILCCWVLFVIFISSVFKEAIFQGNDLLWALCTAFVCLLGNFFLQWLYRKLKKN